MLGLPRRSGGSHGSDRRFDPGKPGNRIATDWVTAGFLNSTCSLDWNRALPSHGEVGCVVDSATEPSNPTSAEGMAVMASRSMELNVQSGHGKDHTARFCSCT